MSFSQTIVAAENTDPLFFIVPKRDDLTHAQMGPGIKRVKITLYPFRWLVELLLATCPNLREIRLLPTYANRVPHIQTWCAGRAILITLGHRFPDQAQTHAYHRTRAYKKERAIFRSLTVAERQRLNQLVCLKRKEAEILFMYFGLRGRPSSTFTEICQRLNRASTSVSRVCCLGRAAMHFVSPRIPAHAKESKAHVLRLQSLMRAARERKRQAEKQVWRQKRERERQKRLAKKLGFPVAYPAGLPQKEYRTFERLLQPPVQRRLAKLSEKYPKRFRAVSLHFGLGQESPVFRRHAVIARMSGVTRAAISEQYVRARKFLKI